MLIFYGYFIKNAVASQYAVLKIEAPAEVDLNSITMFNISIVAENAESLYGWELVLTWSPSVINCTVETINYNIWSADNYLGPWVTMPIDNLNGKYWQSLTGKPPAVPQNGTFWLVNLTFQIVGTPPTSTDFIIQKAEGYEDYCL